MQIQYTFIIPHYNIPDLLMRCLKSIPVREDIQVIVVDDCSPDFASYRNQYPELSRPYLEVYQTSQGGSAGRARNVGLEHAKGKWILFIDADDYFTDKLTDILAEYAESEYDVIHFKEDSFIEGTAKQSDRHCDRNAGLDEYLMGHLSAREAALWHTAVVAQMIYREYIEKNHIRFDEVRVAEDIMFTAKLSCLTNRIHISNKVLYVVSARESGLHTTVDKDFEKYLIFNRIKLQFVRYISKCGVKRNKPCMLKFIHETYRIYGIHGALEAFLMVIKENALFYGFGEYLIRKIRK